MRAVAFANTVSHLLLLGSASAATCPSYDDVKIKLGGRLSPGSSISDSIASAPRWSLFGAPAPAFVVTVTAESDVALTVKYANSYSLPFLLQSRGNGWADTFDLGACGILINIANLDTITFNANKTLATVQGGALAEDLVNSAYGNNTRFAGPTCNCLGVLGANLGGGLTRAMGLYGAGVDQIVSVNIVLASGQELHVDANHHEDLWFAIRGAVSNFGIVTSAVVKVYPVPQAQNVAWQGALAFADDKLEALVQAIRDLNLTTHMEIDLLFGTSGPPAYTPSITAIPIFFGPAAAARVAFAPIIDIGPISNTATEIPYTQWAAFANSFCQQGERKPAYGASLLPQGMEPATWRAVYEDFKSFVIKYPQAANSSILAEYYPVQKAVAIGKTGLGGSYPFRNIPIHVVAIPWYADSSLDPEANAFGSRVRGLLRLTGGLASNSTYINFAHGDETLEEIYGESLPRLQALKKQYDPQNRFNQWFNLSPQLGSGEVPALDVL